MFIPPLSKKREKGIDCGILLPTFLPANKGAYHLEGNQQAVKMPFQILLKDNSTIQSDNSTDNFEWSKDACSSQLYTSETQYWALVSGISFVVTLGIGQNIFVVSKWIAGVFSICIGLVS